MARTPFKLRSGNSTPFKQMGSSPAKLIFTQKQKIEQGIENPGAKDTPPPKTVKDTPPPKTDRWTKMQAESAKKDPRYGNMTAAEYKAEVKRQVASKAKTDSYDAMGVYDAKGEKKVVKTTPKPEQTFKPGGEGDVLTKAMLESREQQTPKENPQGTRAKRIASGKKLKSEQKVAKIAATADVKTARAKSGRGSAEVKAAKAKRKALKRAQKTARLERKRDVTLGVGGTGASQRAARISKRIEKRKAKAAKA